MKLQLEHLLSMAVRAAMNAGSEILDVYCQSEVEVEHKKDNSPVTKADIRAHAVIEAILRETNIPILSEEGIHLPFEERNNWQTLWIIDPLDGTNEFVAKSGDFCVNIALVDSGEPILGVIYSPTRDTVWFGAKDLNAYKIENVSTVIDDFSFETLQQNGIKMPFNATGNQYIVLVSRSNLNEATKTFIETLKTEYKELTLAHIGSALKFCVLAEGAANLYPRYATTSEWDTAAGHAILKSLGGDVLQKDSNIPLMYNKANLNNPGFVAYLKK